MSLTERERERYKRQMILEGWGEEAQERLQGATAFVAGAGGLGSPVIFYLAVAGVGHLRVCDFDAPELSNLNRQILHSDARIGVNKAVSAQQTVAELNPDVQVTPLTDRIGVENIDGLVGEASLIVDCMDNFPTRYLLNECAMRKGIPLVHGSVWGLEGRLTFVRAPHTPCLQCVFPVAPAPEVFPVVGATPGVIGCLQALEAVKHLAGVGQNLEGVLLVWDGTDMSFRNLRTRQVPDCPACSAA